MFKNWRGFLLCLVAVAMTSATAQAATTTLYEQDFNTGPTGPLSHANYGWIADLTGGQTGDVWVTGGSFAGTLWGIQADIATGVEHWTKTFDTPIPAGTTTVTATANTYLQWTGNFGTRGDNGYGFRSDPGTLDAGLSYDGSTAATGGWKLYADGGGPPVLMFPQHYNGTSLGIQNVQIEVTLDLVNDTLTGTVNSLSAGLYGGSSTKTISTGGLGSAAILAGRVHYHTDLINSGNIGGLDLDDILVTAETGLTGDFDMNGVVDGEDYLLWQRDMGVGDLADWQANYGATTLAVAATSAVPEPTSGLLLAFGVVGLSSALRRKFNSLGRFRQ